jgi:D-arabinose 1-dehydrogenase-like Zn-dependent alcohol dehydrogenase
VGSAPNATLAALHSLRRGGRLVLMGSMTTDLPIPYTTVMLAALEAAAPTSLNISEAGRRRHDAIAGGSEQRLRIRQV